MALTRSLLGQNAFRRFYRGGEQSPDGYWEPKKFNASLYDIVMGCFADRDKNHVMANLDSIREALIVLMAENDDFIQAIELSTSSVRMVRSRFDIWRSTLEGILSRSGRSPGASRVHSSKSCMPMTRPAGSAASTLWNWTTQPLTT